MDEGPTLNSPSDGLSLNIFSGDSWSLARALGSHSTFSLRDGFSPCSSDGACSAVAERSVSTAQSDCVGRGIHRLAGMPRILAAELLGFPPNNVFLPQGSSVTILVSEPVAKHKVTQQTSLVYI
jgi:hypothetical protein